MVHENIYHHFQKGKTLKTTSRPTEKGMFPPWALTSPQILYLKETLSNQGKCSCYNERGEKARYTLCMYYSNFVFPKHIYA